MQLLEDQSLDKITMGMVAEKSGYARRTLYRHFMDMDDLLYRLVERLTLELFDEIEQRVGQAFDEAVFQFFHFWEQYQPLLSTLRKKDLLADLQRSWGRHISKLSLGRGDLAGNDYALHFALGGMFSMFLNWIGQDFTQSPEEMRQVALAIQEHLK
nr:TetR/AcrR family transcriptional regulator [Streptococcus panodentis]